MKMHVLRTLNLIYLVMDYLNQHMHVHIYIYIYIYIFQLHGFLKQFYQETSMTKYTK